MESNQAPNIIAALDIGTSKVSVAVAEEYAPGKITVIGIGKVPSNGMSEGNIQDVESAVFSIRQAVNEAQSTSGKTITHVNAALTGKSLRCVNKEGQIVLHEEEVRDEDVAHVTHLARQYDSGKNSDERVVMHAIRGYRLDDNTNPIVHNPIGMSGRVLKAYAHLAVGSDTGTLNLVRCIKKAGLTVDSVIVRPWASASSCLTPTEKKIGVILLDIGEGSTDIACYQGNMISYTSVARNGGYDITRDIATSLHCSLEDALAIKQTYGHLGVREEDRFEKIRYVHDVDRLEHEVTSDEIEHIINFRLADILSGIRHKHLDQDHWLQRAAHGVVVTGGGAKLPGLVEYMQRLWNVQVRIGTPNQLESSGVSLSDPEDATVMGVLVEAELRRQLLGKTSKIHNSSLMHGIKRWIFGDYYE